MKALAVFTLASVLGVTGAMAQSTTVIRRDSDMGSRTVVRDRGDDSVRTRVHVRERHHGPALVVRRSQRLVTGAVGGGCRTVIIKKTNAMGDRVTKKIKKCD
jgi:hypothetical protein